MNNEELILEIDEQFPEMDDSDKREIYFAMIDDEKEDIRLPNY